MGYYFLKLMFFICNGDFIFFKNKCIKFHKLIKIGNVKNIQIEKQRKYILNMLNLIEEYEEVIQLFENNERNNKVIDGDINPLLYKYSKRLYRELFKLNNIKV